MRILNDKEILAVLLIQDIDGIGFFDAVNLVFGRETEPKEAEAVSNRTAEMRREMLAEYPDTSLE